MKKTSLILFLLVCSLATYSQTISKSKEEKIRTLLELTGSGKLGEQMATNFISILKKSYSDVNQKFWDDFSKEIKAEDLVNLIVPIYDKYYTEDDINQLIDFYNSPVGKKTIQSLPAVTQESMAAGQAWGKEIGERVVERLKKEGYK